MNADDPLVRLLPSRLKAARTSLGWSLRELAKQAHLRYQTVDAMERSDTKKKRRCRRSTRDRLAAALGLPGSEGSEWLGGERHYLLSGLHRSAEGSPVIFTLEGSPTEIDLLRWRLLQQCLNAWSRDTAGDAQSVPSSEWSQLRLRYEALQAALVHLTQATWWCGQLLEPLGGEEASDAQVEAISIDASRAAGMEPLLSDRTMQAKIERALISAVQGVLEPWLKGAASLDYKNFLALASRRWWEGFPSGLAGSPRKDKGRDKSSR